MLLHVLAESHTTRRPVFLGPVDLLTAQGLADAVGHGESSGRRSYDREFRNDGADLRIGTQPAAQADTERAHMLVIAHGQRDLEILIGMQPAGIFEMTV